MAPRQASPSSNSDLVGNLLDLLRRGDSEGFADCVHPEIEIHTARGVKRGPEAAERWARSAYDHLERRFLVDELYEAGDRVVVLSHVQYVWRESGEVADSTPIGIEMRFKDGRLVLWRFHDDPAEAFAVLRDVPR